MAVATRRVGCTGFRADLTADLRGVLAGAAVALAANPRDGLFGPAFADLLDMLVLSSRLLSGCGPSLLVYTGPIVRAGSQQALVASGVGGSEFERVISGQAVRQPFALLRDNGIGAVLALRVYTDVEDELARRIPAEGGCGSRPVQRPKGWAPLKLEIDLATGDLLRTAEDDAPHLVWARSTSYAVAARSQFYRVRLGHQWLELQFTQMRVGDDAADYDVAVEQRRLKRRRAQAFGRDDDGPSRQRQRTR